MHRRSEAVVTWCRHAECCGRCNADRTGVGKDDRCLTRFASELVHRRLDADASRGIGLAVTSGDVLAGGDGGDHVGVLGGDVGERATRPRPDVDLAEPQVQRHVEADTGGHRRRRCARSTQIARNQPDGPPDGGDEPIGERRARSLRR